MDNCSNGMNVMYEPVAGKVGLPNHDHTTLTPSLFKHTFSNTPLLFRHTSLVLASSDCCLTIARVSLNMCVTQATLDRLRHRGWSDRRQPQDDQISKGERDAGYAARDSRAACLAGVARQSHPLCVAALSEVSAQVYLLRLPEAESG